MNKIYLAEKDIISRHFWQCLKYDFYIIKPEMESYQSVGAHLYATLCLYQVC